MLDRLAFEPKLRTSELCPEQEEGHGFPKQRSPTSTHHTRERGRAKLHKLSAKSMPKAPRARPLTTLFTTVCFLFVRCVEVGYVQRDGPNGKCLWCAAKPERDDHRIIPKSACTTTITTAYLQAGASEPTACHVRMCRSNRLPASLKIRPTNAQPLSTNAGRQRPQESMNQILTRGPCKQAFGRTA